MASSNPLPAIREQVPLRPFTTLGVGGAARWFLEARSAGDVAAAHLWCAERGAPLFILGGGSNVVVADGGYDGLVLRMRLMGVSTEHDGGDTLVTAGAGEPWDDVVRSMVDRGLQGVECLSGIPGSAGGTPVQNVGAYGQDVSGAIESVTAFDRRQSVSIDIPASDCGFAYRMSRFKAEDAGRFVICAVRLRARPGTPTTTYPDVKAELAERGVMSPGVGDVRDAVLTVRRRKGMVLDAHDSDTSSVGSFFMNPIVPADVRNRLAQTAGSVPGFVAADGRVKIPAAWLIEQAGFRKGYGDGPVGLSSKHPLAIVNRGGATTKDVVRFAVTIKRTVIDRCGVWLRPEPVFVGLDRDEDVVFLQKVRD